MAGVRDVVLVTADSVRRDFVDEMPFVSGHDVLTGAVAGHYTRPSLAAFQSSHLRSAVQSRARRSPRRSVRPGTRRSGSSRTPRPDPAFGFASFDNFVSGTGDPAADRGSRLREFLGSFDVVRQVYRRLSPTATMAELPADAAIVDEAVDRFAAAVRPRFLRVHLTGSHRLYGTGD